jgi:hypothetical protein
MAQTAYYFLIGHVQWRLLGLTYKYGALSDHCLTYVYTPFHGSLYLHFAVFSDSRIIHNITTFRNIQPTDTTD